MKYAFLILVSFLMFTSFTKKVYVKKYYESGVLAAEGWQINQVKTDYWFFYFSNGKKKEEGHFKNNQKSKWWIFYNEKGEITEKIEFQNNRKNGYAILYKNNTIVCVQKFKENLKVKQWESLAAFKKDHLLGY